MLDAAACIEKIGKSGVGRTICKQMHVSIALTTHTVYSYSCGDEEITVLGFAQRRTAAATRRARPLGSRTCACLIGRRCLNAAVFVCLCRPEKHASPQADQMPQVLPSQLRHTRAQTPRNAH